MIIGFECPPRSVIASERSERSNLKKIEIASLWATPTPRNDDGGRLPRSWLAPLARNDGVGRIMDFDKIK